MHDQYDGTDDQPRGEFGVVYFCLGLVDDFDGVQFSVDHMLW
jgi:hypothetical protein